MSYKFFFNFILSREKRKKIMQRSVTNLINHTEANSCWEQFLLLEIRIRVTIKKKKKKEKRKKRIQVRILPKVDNFFETTNKFYVNVDLFRVDRKLRSTESSWVFIFLASDSLDHRFRGYRPFVPKVKGVKSS